MPKKLESVSLNTSCVNLIVNYCKKADISEAAFSRKFKKNNGWVTDLRRSKNLNLPSKELAVQMCLTLNVSPDDILLHEGKTPEETKKCLKDIETVRKLVEAEGKKEAPDPKIEGEDAQLAQLIAEFSRLSPQQKSAVLAVIEGYQPSQE
jgi:hypothetical protein